MSSLITKIDELADNYALARDNLQVHPQFAGLGEIREIPDNLKELIGAYNSAREDLLAERIQTDSILPEPLIPTYSGDGSSVDLREQNVRYIFMPKTSNYLTYGQGVDALVKACNKDKLSAQPQTSSGKPRPLTLRETFIARFTDSELWNEWVYTCLGIAYSKQNKDRFKLGIACEELANISANHSGAYLKADYSRLNWPELNRNNGDMFNQRLSKDQFKANNTWFTALEEDRELMNGIANKMYREFGQNKALGFWLLSQGHINEDQVKGVWVSNHNYSSNANGNGSLNLNSRFLRAAHLEMP